MADPTDPTPTAMSLAHLADTTGLTPADVVTTLHTEADWWVIQVRLNRPIALFYVSGEVYPFRTNGQRAKRGKLPFYGEPSVDATKALYLGLLALRDLLVDGGGDG